MTRTVNAAFAHHQAGRLARAEALYRKALVRDPGHAEALHLLGVVAYQTGKPDLAIDLIGRALAELGDLPEAHLNLGNSLREAGRLGAAADSYRRAVALDADYGMAHNNLARVLIDLGQPRAALASSERAVELIPEFAGAHLNHAAALIGLERFAEAEAPLCRALALMPNGAQTHRDLARVLCKLGRLEEAAERYQRALALEPDHPQTHFDLGNTLQALGQGADAAESYCSALRLRPDFAEAHNNFGRVLQAQNHSADAMASYRRALALQPDFAEAHHNLGNLLMKLGRFEEAAASFNKSASLRPQDAAAHADLGSALLEQYRLDDAVSRYRLALALKPDYALAYNNLGNALQLQQRLDEAVASYQGALALQPEFAAAHYNLALALSSLGRMSEATAAARRAVELDPDNTGALAVWFELTQRLCDWRGQAKNENRVRSSLARQPLLGAALTFLTLSSTPEEQLGFARAVAAGIAVPEVERLPPRKPKASGPMRLGYISADLRTHPVGLLVSQLIEMHDRKRFEVVGYFWGPDNDGAMRARLAGAFDRFVNISGMAHRQAAERIHGDAVDILIDLTGYTANGRPAILAHRPAPIVVNYLGYPGTMGADFIDYIIVDRFLVPRDQQPFYSERLVHLPNCYQPSDTTRQIAQPAPSRAQCGLPEAGFVFCCFNNSYKITPRFFAIWTELLRAVPGSVLWLFATNSWTKDNLRRAAARCGVAAERLVFARWTPMPEYLARLSVADLFLDTLPYNAGATANDALWVGLPVLTCAGTTYAGRMAGAQLTAIGLPELITTAPEEYAALALRLATEPGRLAALRQKLVENRSTMPLFDMVRFTRHLEAAYTRMWEFWKAGRPPAAFSVPASASAG